MANAPLDPKLAQEAIDAVAACDGVVSDAAKRVGLPLDTFRGRVRVAQRLGLKPSAGLVDRDSAKSLAYEVSRLKGDLAAAQKSALDHDAIRRVIIGLKESITPPPEWITRIGRPASAPGVPILFLSDLHWGEVVHPTQINGVNRYSVKIAHERMDTLGTETLNLLKIISPKMDYPGLVLILGGDMISGNIHDELAQSNEMQTMPTVLDLFGKLASFIKFMADRMGKVFLPCVTGNHGRDTHKIYAKDRHHTSFDWLLYQFLAKHFEADKRIAFMIPDGPDAYFKVYNTRYLLTHGDQFKSGDSMIGCLGPIIRGDHKKRSRNGQIDMGYDTMLLGHFHQYIHHGRVIVNGSLKGYDEYAYNGNFGFEQPQQALWVDHPRHGITFRMPVYVDRQRSVPKTAWVSVAA